MSGFFKFLLIVAIFVLVYLKFIKKTEDTVIEKSGDNILDMYKNSVKYHKEFDTSSQINSLPQVKFNNPLALFSSAIPWKGKKQSNTGKLEFFIDSVWGLRAGTNNFTNSYLKKGINNVVDIVKKYTGNKVESSPSFKNYLSVLSKYGFTRVSIINESNKREFLFAVSVAEFGKPLFTQEKFNSMYLIAQSL